MPHELNPNNPAVSTMRDHWHKIAALIMQKQNLTEIEITTADVEQSDGRAIMLDSRDGRLFIRLITMKEAERMARTHGGQFKPS